MRNFIRLRKEDYEKAINYINTLKEKDFQNRRLQKTNDEHITYNLYGIIGEMAFEKYCDKVNIPLKERSNALTIQYRPYDFRLENGKTIDVKSINNPKFNLIIEDYHIIKKPCDYYILVRTPNKEDIERLLEERKYFLCEIIGYANKEYILTKPIIRPRNIADRKVMKYELNKDIKSII